jgi:RNA polymerase sigma-70 factor (ECF subfamily)
MMRSVPLTPEDFAARFETASRKLWCLAAAILGCRVMAQDVLQEAAMTALDRLSTFQPGSNFDAWMARIVRFTALNHSRRHYRSRERGCDAALLQQAPGPRLLTEPGVDPRGRLDGEQQHFDDSVTRALQQLGELPRASFLLRTLMDLSYREISSLLEIPEGTAMSHVHRARASLRETLLADVSFEPFAGWRAS